MRMQTVWNYENIVENILTRHGNRLGDCCKKNPPMNHSVLF